MSDINKTRHFYGKKGNINKTSSGSKSYKVEKKNKFSATKDSDRSMMNFVVKISGAHKYARRSGLSTQALQITFVTMSKRSMNS